MKHHSSSSTSLTLIQRLHDVPTDHEAWREVVQRYGPVIRAWACARGLQEADVQDVSQTVLFRLMRGMARFRHDRQGSFRAYLRTLTRHALADAVEELQRPDVAAGAGAIVRRLADLEARDDLARRIEEEFDLELLQAALDRVEPEVEPHTWQAFYLTTFTKRSSQEVAERLGISVARVYVARSRVSTMVKKAIRLLGGAEASPDHSFDGELPR
jgi:RNA polymerase sigma-70 factor (ECF subfamily)